MYTLEKNNTSPLCILYTLMPQRLPFLTLTLVCTWYEKSTPWEATYITSLRNHRLHPTMIEQKLMDN